MLVKGATNLDAGLTIVSDSKERPLEGRLLTWIYLNPTMDK